MALVVADMLRREFAARSEAAVYERIRRQEFDDRKRRDREEKKERDQRIEDDLGVILAVVTTAEVQAFRVELDAYDVATVEALQLNEAELAQVQDKLEKLFAEAHVLPDGRRVFKTEDGARVFDEHGAELPAEEIAPQDIEDWRPKWETVNGVIQERKALERQRTEILEYQQKLDDARERLDAGDLDRKEFDELRKDLKAQMPDAVRAQLPEAEKKPAAPEAAALPNIELEIEDDMVPTMLVAAKAPAPAMP